MAPPPRGPFDVIVLGAGAAGLTAARLLGQAGRKVLVVDARERCGGRIHTVRPPGSSLAIELGAEFVHGDSPSLWECLRRSSAVPCEVEERRYAVRHGHWRKPP